MKEAVAKALAAALPKLGGAIGWLLQLILPYAFKLLKEWGEMVWKEQQLKKKDEALLKEYQDAVASQTMSREERRKMAERLLNRDS